MMVPFLDLKTPYAELEKEVNAGIAKVLHNTNFILGQEVVEFEQAFAAFSECRHGIGVASGLDAIKLALRALRIGPGDEVITAANTFIATVLAVTSVGAKPVLVDIDPRTYNLDPALVKAALTPRTRAIIPVHLYGQPADMDPLLALAREARVHILEDASQAHGARYHGRRVGGLSDIAAFSLYPGKNLGAYGDAGIVTTQNAELADYVATLRNYGSKVKYYHAMLGENSRLDTLQAAVLKIKLTRLDGWNAGRRRVAAWYDQFLAGVPGVVTPYVAPGVEPVYHLYVIRAPRRDELMNHLKEQGVGTIIHYPVPIHLQEAYRDAGWKPGDFPITEKYAGEILSLPMFPNLTVEQVRYVADCIRRFFGAA